MPPLHLDSFPGLDLRPEMGSYLGRQLEELAAEVNVLKRSQKEGGENEGGCKLRGMVFLKREDDVSDAWLLRRVVVDEEVQLRIRTLRG